METISRTVERPVSAMQKKMKPVVIRWQGKKMLRSHSINACVDEIYESSRDMGFIKINIIGASASGKTTLGKVISHQLHKRDTTFEVHFLKDNDLVDFTQTIKNLSDSNQILVFDDLSGLKAKYGNKAIDTIEAEMTTIRHIDEEKGKDRKIIMMLNFHAQKKLSKFLRISNFTFYTDCQNEEVGYLQEYLGKDKTATITKFRDLRASSRIFHKFHFKLGKREGLTYKDGDPFRILLYNNSLTTRFVVSPELEWILGDEKCSICFPAQDTKQVEMDTNQLLQDYRTKFGDGNAKKAVELMLLRMGKITQTKRVQQAGTYLNQYMAKKDVSIEDIMKEFGLEERRTRLDSDKKPEYVKEINPLVPSDKT